MKMVSRHVEVIEAGLNSPLTTDQEKTKLRYLNKFRDNESFPLNTHEIRLLSEIERRLKSEN